MLKSEYMDGEVLQYLLLFLEGIITFISPCLLPMLPVNVSFFAAGEPDKHRALVNSLGFVSGFTLVFVILGAFAGTIGRLLAQHTMMVNLADGQRETKENGEAYVSENGFAFPVYYNTNQEGAYAYGIRSIPTTIFIDSGGYIITGAEGQIDEKTLRYGISLIQSAIADNEAENISAPIS